MIKLNLKLKCKVCGKKYISYVALSRHIRFEHKLSPKDYYDKYLKKSDEGICALDGCDKVTRFKSMQEGYNKFCCVKCGNAGREIRREVYIS